jgi:hypothetical protein
MTPNQRLSVPINARFAKFPDSDSAQQWLMVDTYVHLFIDTICFFLPWLTAIASTILRIAGASSGWSKSSPKTPDGDLCHS